jgi:hypothetical protein
MIKKRSKHFISIGMLEFDGTECDLIDAELILYYTGGWVISYNFNCKRFFKYHEGDNSYLVTICISGDDCTSYVL